MPHSTNKKTHLYLFLNIYPTVSYFIECYTTGWPECCGSGEDEDPNNNNNNNSTTSDDGGCPQGEEPECDKTLLGDPEDSSGASTGVLFLVAGTTSTSTSTMVLLGVAGSGFVLLF